MTIRIRLTLGHATALHLGQARILLLNWLLARHDGGDVILRLDNAEGEAAPALDELRWLGLNWDATHRTAERGAAHERAITLLRQTGRIYPCFEGEEELRVKRELRVRRGQPSIYDRAMLKLTTTQREAAEAGGKRPYWRFLLSNRVMSWEDLGGGRPEAKLPSLSDPILVTADGLATPTLAAAVDDLDDRITHILRSTDRISTSAIHLDLIEALGGNARAFRLAHVPPLTPAPGRRPSLPALRSLMRDGVEPEAIVGTLAAIGTGEAPHPATPAKLAAKFRIGQLGRAPAVFDPPALLAANAAHLRTLPYEVVKDRLPPAAPPAFWLAVRGSLDLLSEARGWWEVVSGDIVPPVIDGAHELLTTALRLLPAEPWDEGSWGQWIGALSAETGQAQGELHHVLAMALTGEERDVDLHGLLPLMGHARAAARLQLAAA